MTTPSDKPLALDAMAVAPNKVPSVSPEPFYGLLKHRVHRVRRALGNAFGLKNFGVNLTLLPSGSRSAMLHRHSKQDEFIYVVERTPTLVTDQGEQQLAPGMCAGFPAGGVAHCLVSNSGANVVYVEVSDRTPDDDDATYPNDDLKAELVDGRWVFSHKDGRPY
ncbi:MAG: cupin domain-containing protein [Alphaproteobacteria bacterium]|nr:cupin domain-containing protein [Alphaproteobacteria bacterium]